MKFTINRNLFLEKLQIAQKAMASKSNMPALTGIYVACKDEEITLIASNSDISIKVIINDSSLEILEEGKCLIPGRLFGDIIRKLNGEDVEIELEEDNILRIQSGTSDITLNLLEIEDYPEQKFVLSENPIKIKVSLLKEIIKETAFASSNYDNKPILMGINLRISGNNLLAVATDSFRLSKRNAILDDEYLDTNIIVPSRNMNEFAKIFVEDQGIVEIHVSQNTILFKNEELLFKAKLLEGNYPETSKLIPTAFPVILKYNKDDLISAIDRVSTLSSNPNTSTVIKMIIEENGEATLTSNSPELGTIKDKIAPIEANSTSPLTISFSANFFLDALRAFYSSEVYVKFNGEIRPFIFEADNDEGLVELVLPMKSE